MGYRYDRFPHLDIDAGEVVCGYDAIIQVIRGAISHRPFVLAVETYPGVRDEEVVPELERLSADCFVNMRDLYLPDKDMSKRMAPWLTDDRVFGRMYYGTVEEFLVPQSVAVARAAVGACEGLSIVYGMGATLLCDFGCCVYLDLTRWEIQLRYRAGMANYNCSNHDEDILRKYKRGYFVEWRMADRIKRGLGRRIDFVVDTNRAHEPKMISGSQFFKAIETFATSPFRMVPYFDPGVWGGQWMREHCNLDPEPDNYAWAFDGVMEEDSIRARFGTVDVELPAIDVVLFAPKELLGERNHSRFGAEFPIRFDLLDTVGGQNLSLQVHPTTDYIRGHFGMAYTQDESYYLLDATDDACVYLGVRRGVRGEEMLAALWQAQETGEFDAERYVNRLPAKRHDHFSIPAGTVHCSGAGAMVLEVSATPYIFTFKLWDWGRLGLDGKPRPISIERGAQVIQWERDTDWVEANLVSRPQLLHDGDDYTEEATGLHELEFVETRRYTIRTFVELGMRGSFSICNLVDGVAAKVVSPTGAFEPLEVHHAETFVIPAAAGMVRIEPMEGEVMLLRAYVRGSQRPTGMAGPGHEASAGHTTKGSRQ